MESDFFILIIITVVSIALAGYLFFSTIKTRKNFSLLIKQLDNYNSIIDQANDMMIVIDIADGKIHQANPSAAKHLGYSDAELSKLSLFDLHPPEYLNKSSEIVADVWEKGGLIYKDIPFITKTKHIIPVECSAKVATFAGRPAIVIYARDITERLRLEKEINQQRVIIDAKNKDILDSIEYSKRIQESVFLEKDRLKQLAPESFIFFKPRDVVSGDFYWFADLELKPETNVETNNSKRLLVLAAVDCTGHGVPGAFVSIIGNALLNRAIYDADIHSPAQALDHMNTELKTSLNKNKNIASLRDGMDISLCFIDMKARMLEYAGANNPIYIVRRHNDTIELMEFKADKQAITPSVDTDMKPFTNKHIELQKDDIIYLFTDGYPDQFGGLSTNHRPDGKKFLIKRFKEKLISINGLSMTAQNDELTNILADWQGELPQVDDVLVIGIKIP